MLLHKGHELIQITGMQGFIIHNDDQTIIVQKGTLGFEELMIELLVFHLKQHSLICSREMHKPCQALRQNIIPTMASLLNPW